MCLDEYVKLKKLDPADVTPDKAFRYGQLTVVALFADLMHLSLSFQDWETSIPKMFEMMGAD